MSKIAIFILLCILLPACQRNEVSQMSNRDTKLEESKKDTNSIGQVAENYKPEESEEGWIGINGIAAKAFLVTYQDFLGDGLIPTNQKKIENYNIGIKETKDIFLVNYIPHQKGGAVSSIGGATALGSPIQYKIDKNSLKIIERKRPV